MKLLVGNCIELMQALESSSVDAIVTDPPYGLSKQPDIAEVMQHWIAGDKYEHKHAGFMGKSWDSFVPGPEYWREVYRVLKPGAHICVFAGTRTFDLMCVAIRFAGFEIRDQIQWLQGQGFPKSLDVRKAAIKAGLACECDTLSEHKMRSLCETDLPSPIDAENERGQILQPSMSEQNPYASGLQGSATIRQQKPMLAGRQLCRASERVSIDSYATASQGPQKRLCSGAYSRSGKDAGSTTQEVGSRSPHQPQASRQPTEEFEGLLQSQRALDGTPLPRCSKCQRSIFPEGLGSALKPANEPICVARKPLEKGLTVAENVEKWGTGAINIDGCRIATEELKNKVYNNGSQRGQVDWRMSNGAVRGNSIGRFPANVILDEEAAQLLDGQTGELKSAGRYRDDKVGLYQQNKAKKTSMFGVGRNENAYANEKGGASRFFYCAKASTSERNAGLEQREPKKVNDGRETPIDNPFQRGETPRKNVHPTVKPVKLMEYLCRLITPPGGIVLDPFMGSGTTGIAAKNLGFDFIGMELNPEYFEIAKRRIENWKVEVQSESQLELPA